MWANVRRPGAKHDFGYVDAPEVAECTTPPATHGMNRTIAAFSGSRNLPDARPISSPVQSPKSGASRAPLSATGPSLRTRRRPRCTKRHRTAAAVGTKMSRAQTKNPGPKPEAFKFMVRAKGLEPSWGCPHTDLNRTRLPIPPRPQMQGSYYPRPPNSGKKNLWRLEKRPLRLEKRDWRSDPYPSTMRKSSLARRKGSPGRTWARSPRSRRRPATKVPLALPRSHSA